MSNTWGVPEKLERAVWARDKKCVYCRVVMVLGDSKKKPTWEHIDNDEKNVSVRNICLCCASCNSSKGAKKLSAWLKSDFCRRKGIDAKSVAPIIKNALSK